MPGERAPADPLTIESRKRVAELRELGITESAWKRLVERAKKDKAAEEKAA